MRFIFGFIFLLTSISSFSQKKFEFFLDSAKVTNDSILYFIKGLKGKDITGEIQITGLRFFPVTSTNQKETELEKITSFESNGIVYMVYGISKIKLQSLDNIIKSLDVTYFYNPLEFDNYQIQHELIQCQKSGFVIKYTAPKDTIRYDYSPHGDTFEEASINSRFTSKYHEYSTPITYYDYVFVEIMIQSFLGNILEIYQSGEPQYISGVNFDVIKTKYMKPSMGDSNPPYLQTNCTIFKNKAGHDIVQKYVISGYSKYILDFYTQYWPTPVNFKMSGNSKIAYTTLWLDHIELKLDLAKQIGTITISNNKFKSTSEYEVYLSKKISERKK